MNIKLSIREAEESKFPFLLPWMVIQMEIRTIKIEVPAMLSKTYKKCGLSHVTSKS